MENDPDTRVQRLSQLHRLLNEDLTEIRVTLAELAVLSVKHQEEMNAIDKRYIAQKDSRQSKIRDASLRVVLLQQEIAKYGVEEEKAAEMKPMKRPRSRSKSAKRLVAIKE